MKKTKEQARETLASFLPFLDLAFKEMRKEMPNANPQMATIAREESGEGKVFYAFNFEEILEDLNIALELPEPTEDQVGEAKVLLMMTRLGLK